MNNQDLAEIFDRIASLLEIKGEERFKTTAYRRAADSLRDLAEDINTVHTENRLTKIPGIGKAIAEKISELLSTGRLNFLEKLEAEVPPTLLKVLEVPDVGPKKASLFWKQAGITSLSELKAAAREGKLRDLPGMGKKSEARVLSGIESLMRSSQVYSRDPLEGKRLVLGNILPIANFWLTWLRSLSEVSRAEIAGSVRRQRTTIGDIDLVAASHEPAIVMQAFTSHKDVHRVISQGENKSSIELFSGHKIQLWIQPAERFGSLWQFATGSKNHNVHLREKAQKNGLSLSERGFLNTDGTEILCPDEETVYKVLEMDWIEPEMREDRGEIDAALSKKMPRLITRDDLQSDLHCHSNWSDGHDSIRSMAESARKRGLRALAITDHSMGMAIAGGLTMDQIKLQREEIQRIQQKMGDSITILQGTEVDIRADGELDYPDEILAMLDIVVASIHFSIHQPREIVTKRLIKAMQNPYVHIIGHPTSRLLPNRIGADLDWEQIFEHAHQNNVVLEINSNPYRMDLDEILARRAVEKGVLLSIDTDAHSTDQLDQVHFGIAVARRAWLEPKHIINSWDTQQLNSWLAEKRAGHD